MSQLQDKLEFAIVLSDECERAQHSSIFTTATCTYCNGTGLDPEIDNEEPTQEWDEGMDR